tara:strand:+ start:371 stop:523 length:153 start_codon:yes stop_codon:yes gene_type:complete
MMRESYALEAVILRAVILSKYWTSTHRGDTFCGLNKFNHYQFNAQHGREK